MVKNPWSKFFWSDWEADQGLRLCSLQAQGLWMRILCVCARHDPKGYLAINGNPLSVDAIARLAGIAENEAEILIAELDLNGVFSRNRKGTIYSRRMVNDEKKSQEGRKHKKRGIAQGTDNIKEKPPPSRGPTRGPSPQKPEARYQSKKEEPKGSQKKAKRLPEDWVLPDEWRDWAINEGLDEFTVRRQADRFRDYWIAAPKGLKLDWQATWRNWIRNATGDKPSQQDAQTKYWQEIAEENGQTIN